MQQHQQQLAQQQSALGWDATDGGDSDLDAIAVEAALGVERATNAHIVKRQLTPTCDSRVDCDRPSGLPSIVSNADSDQWPNQPWTGYSVDQRVGGIALVFHSCLQPQACPLLSLLVCR
jgi:hypothetical protein